MANIIVVDDRAANREFLVTLLTYSGHHVIEASDGSEGLAFALKERPDLVISDILMPTMDGYELVQELRREPMLASTPVIFYTAHFQISEAKKVAQDLNVAHVLTMPAEPEHVLEVVNAALGGGAAAATGRRRKRTAPAAPPARLLRDRLEATVDALSIANERLQALIEAGLELASQHDSAALLTATCKHARELVTARYAIVAAMDGNADDGVLSATAGFRTPLDAQLRSADFTHGLVGRAYMERQSTRVASVTEAPAAFGLPDAHPPFHSLLISPVASVSRTYGWIAVSDKVGGWEFSAEDERLLAMIAALAGRAFESGRLYNSVQENLSRLDVEMAERSRAQQLLAESEFRFRQITENIREVFWLTDPAKHEMLYINPAYEEIWGRNCAELYASPRTWLDSIHPDDRAAVSGAIGKQAEGVYDERYRIVRPDGSIRWIRDRAFPILDAEGRIYRVAGIAEDVTDFQTQSRKIEKLSRIRTISSLINALIVRVGNVEELFQEACRIATEHGGFGIAWVGAFDTSTMTATPVAWSGPSAAEYIAHIPSSVGERLASMGALGRAIKSASPAFDNDMAQRPNVGGVRRREAIRLGFRSSIVLPLIVEGHVTALMTLLAKESNFFDDEEVAILSELAGNVAFAMAYMSRRTKLEKLSRIRAFSSAVNAAIVRVHDVEELLREACHIAVERGRFELVWVALVNTENERLRAISWHGFPDEVAQAVRWPRVPGVGTIEEVIRTRRIAVRNDVEKDAPGGWLRQEALRRGCPSTVCLPFLVDGGVVAIMNVFATGPGFFDEEELALLDEIGADVSFALQYISRQRQLDYLSYFDPLTGLPNRALFLDRAAQQLHTRAGESSLIALVLLNLERFRNINETFGRDGGDALLRAVASRLAQTLPAGDLIARISGDVFGIVLRDLRGVAAAAHAIEAQILTAFREPLALASEEIRVSAKAGIALFPTDGEDVDTLFKNAEAALKNVQAGRERFLFYAAPMNSQAAHALSLENRLRKAVEKGEFMLHYQPKLTLATGELSGVEALIRWQEPGQGLVPPHKFIPVLEETGLIIEVGAWVIQQALADFCQWEQMGYSPPRIAVNVSSVQMQHRAFVETVTDAVQRAGDIPEALELEVTESILMTDVQANERKLATLRGIGIHIAVDDFGTGYSSLTYIARLPLDSIKIDRSFIGEMMEASSGRVIVETIIALARSLKLRAVAEGIETEAQAALLRQLRCDEGQGYHFGKPMPARSITALLAQSAEVAVARKR